jgi:hypothetical protein
MKVSFSLFFIISLANLVCYCDSVSSYTHPTDSETKIRHIRRRDEVKKSESHYYDNLDNLDNLEDNGDNTNPTIITNYIGRWTPMIAQKNMYVFAGFGSTINTEDDRLSSKKLERMIGYGYKNNDVDDYTVYFEVIPHDGSYWHLLIANLTTGQYKYTLVYDYTGGILVWGSPF